MASLVRRGSSSNVIRSFSQRIFGIPLLYKVLVANALIVVAGAVVGTTVTSMTVSNDDEAISVGLIAAFVVIGGALSITVNYLVLRAAFQPLDRLAEVADVIRTGVFSARVRATLFSDPQLARLAESFNETLDELEQDRNQLRQLTSQVIHAQEEERKRIARELHDDTAQGLFAQLLTITAMKSSRHTDVQQVAESLEASTVEAIEGVRRLALELRPPALDDLGLREALADMAQRYSEQTDIPVGYQWNGPRERLPAELELVLYRIAQEAMTNVLKHAHASRADITVTQVDADMVLTIVDNGQGFDPDTVVQRDVRGLGLGVFGMAERTSLVGGNLGIEAAEPYGVRVVATVPIGRMHKVLDRSIVAHDSQQPERQGLAHA